MRAGARLIRDEPFRRHHDCRALSEFHPPRCGTLFLLGIPATAAAIAHPRRRGEERMSHHHRRVVGRGFTFVAGILAIAF
jgi:hypothetical protein